jgi:hypothetical protein
LHWPELARDPLMKEFVDGRRGQVIASSDMAASPRPGDGRT